MWYILVQGLDSFKGFGQDGKIYYTYNPYNILGYEDKATAAIVQSQIDTRGETELVRVEMLDDGKVYICKPEKDISHRETQFKRFIHGHKTVVHRNNSVNREDKQTDSAINTSKGNSDIRRYTKLNSGDETHLVMLDDGKYYTCKLISKHLTGLN